MDKKSDFVIYETFDYDKFSLLEANRELGTIIELEESVDAIGLIPIPAIVNEKYEIIDGQHRFIVSKKKGLPFRYVIVNGLTAETCPWLNKGQKNWKAANYLHLFARLGNENYQRIEKLVEYFKGAYGLEDILCFIMPSGVSGGTHCRLLREQAIELSQERAEIIEARLKKARQLGLIDLQKERRLSKRAWWSAISYAFKHQDVPITELAAKLNKSPLELQSYTKTEDMLRVFDEINNKGKKNKVFMAADYQLGKYKNI